MRVAFAVIIALVIGVFAGAWLDGRARESRAEQVQKETAVLQAENARLSADNRTLNTALDHVLRIAREKTEPPAKLEPWQRDGVIRPPGRPTGQSPPRE